MNKDLIKRLQQNEKPFGLMDEDMQEAAKSIKRKGNFEIYHSTDMSEDGWNMVTVDTGLEGSERAAHRLRAVL